MYIFIEIRTCAYVSQQCNEIVKLSLLVQPGNAAELYDKWRQNF